MGFGGYVIWFGVVDYNGRATCTGSQSPLVKNRWEPQDLVRRLPVCVGTVNTGGSMGIRHASVWWRVIGFNHGLPWCVKYMARGPPVTTKPDGEAGGFCGDRRPEGHVFHTSRQAMIKTYYSTSIRKNMIQNCSYFTQIKSTMTAIDDSNRRRNKLGLGCSREATAPLILIFKLRFLWLNIGRYFKGIAQFHNCHSPKHTSKKYYLVINIFRKICTKIIT